MHDLYARIVLWLIGPALRRKASTEPDLSGWLIRTIVQDLRRNGPIGRAIREGVQVPDRRIPIGPTDV